jgi:membrane protein required for colicin V production
VELNIFDVVVLLITLMLAIKGFFNGIIKEISGLIGIALGSYLGTLYYKEVGLYINEHIFKIANESAINVVGFVAVFLLTWGVLVIIGMLLSRLLFIAQLGILDRVGGVIFSAGKFFVILAVIVTMLSKIEAMHKTMQNWSKNSITYPYLIKIGNSLINLKSDDVQKQINDVKTKINNNIGEDIKKKIEETKEKIADSVSKNIKPAIDKALENKGE